ncbi:hypothetical protein [Nocardiopsis composta]|uniref:Pimeloyl-ACP methyl ester carboxylesterase n=1 Tax=Nocardiopsis composta TaxID=157465 RepID=A0A7W8QPA9_9ACTN|nr:hypothetical protein [Nocardiopsis composta]MBB5433984.1 pimeloyl-ACP methyl ester carboxylesterase [Nocardiopsis composta]
MDPPPQGPAGRGRRPGPAAHQHQLYWLTGTGSSSAYVGYAQESSWGEPARDSGVPTGVIAFAHDIGIRRYAEQENTVVRWTDADRGGHFAALEEPEALTADVREFFRPLR